MVVGLSWWVIDLGYWVVLVGVPLEIHAIRKNKKVEREERNECKGDEGNGSDEGQKQC